MAWPSEIAPLTAPDSLTVKYSSCSTFLSPSIVTVIVFVVSPGAK